MGWGTGNIGGGYGGLNFKVVGGTSEPASPKENTIWVNTDIGITSYIFSTTEPESPVEGMVWISTGTYSAVTFNALKKNGLQVYPIAAKQYVGGAWTDVMAKSYQGGEWVDWIYYITKDGAFYNGHELVTEYNQGGTLTIENGVGVRYKSPTTSTYVYTNYGELDTSKFKTITMTVIANTGFSNTSDASYNGVCAMFLTLPGESEAWDAPQARLKTAVSGTEYVLSVDLSGLNDVRLVKVYANNCNNVDFTVKSIIAE